MRVGEVFYAGDRAITRVMKSQRRQTIGYWVSSLSTVEELGKFYKPMVWGSDFGWSMKSFYPRGVEATQVGDSLLCAVDELDEPETNEFGPVCP